MKKYDAYKDSGIEWIGVIPSHWKDVRIKHLAIGENTLFLDGDWIESKEIVFDEDNIKYITTGNIGEGKYKEQGSGYITEETFEKLNCTEVFPGDLVISRLNPPIGRACIIPNLGKRIVTSVDNVILRPNQEYSKDFLAHFFSNPKYYEYTLIEGRGATMQRISRGILGNIKIVVPDNVEEQTAIATYLDRKTAEIDELIADKKRLLELYEEEKTAIINQAVTKGVNPDVPMKDSGIEWLGEIPEHWDVKRIGHCGKIVRGGSPRPTGDPRFFFGDYIHWITVKEVTNAVGKYVVGTEEYLTEDGSKNSRIVEPETLLLSNSGATLGVPKISKIRGCINDGSVAFPELKSFLNRDYLYYFFVSHTDIYREQMAGNGQPNLNTELIKSTLIPLPSTVEEQTAIVEFIESETQKVIAKMAKTEKLIELLTEYRTALISEVVTGKVKVVDL